MNVYAPDYERVSNTNQWRFAHVKSTAQSARDAQLEDAARKSHASRMSHKRRKQLEPEAGQNSDSRSMSLDSEDGNKDENEHAVVTKVLSHAIRDSLTAKSDPKNNNYERKTLSWRPPILSRAHKEPRICARERHSRKENDGNVSTNPLLSPSPVLLQGNSDPCITAALAITPEISRTLTFIRESVLPALYDTEIFRHWSADASSQIDLLATPRIISFRAAYGDWQHQMSWLDDEGMAFAGLSAWYDILPQLDPLQTHGNPSSSINSSEMRARSSALLSQRLRKESDLSSLARETVLHIFWLFRSEAISGSKEAARMHGDRLRAIVKYAYANGTIGMQCLIQFLFVDVDLATSCMERTMFDVEIWFMEVLGQIWERAKSILPPLSPQMHLGLSDTIEIEALREMTTEVRLYVYFCHHAYSREDCSGGSPKEIVDAYSTSRSFIDLGRLVNLYVSLVDHGGAYASITTIGQRYTQACLVLAILFTIRSIGHSAIVMGTDIRDKSSIIMSHLGKSFPFAQCCLEAEKLHYRDAHLWILYIGALHEKRLELAGKKPLVGVVSFTELLIHEALASGVRTWEQMQLIEERFIQTDLLYPQGYTWFEDALARNS